MKIKHFIKLTCTFLLLSSVQSQAALISAFDGFAIGGARDIFTSFNIYLDYPGQSGRLIDLDLSESDVGQRFSLSSGSEFDQLAAFLQNGVDESLRIATRFGSRTANEDIYFPGLNSLPPFQVTQFDFVVTSFTLDTPGRNPNGDGIWTDYDLRYRLEIFGQTPGAVPEPGLPLLLGSGLMLLWAARRRRS